MTWNRKHGPIVLLVITLFTGCISHRFGTGLDEAVIGGVVEKSVEPPLALAEGVNEFRMAKKRWPRNYEELSTFLRDSDEKTFSALLSARFERIDFADMPDGSLEINADYTLRSKGPFSIGNGIGTMRIDDMKVSINRMRVSPFDVSRK